MHDPMSVAFEIRRPWPARSSFGGRQGKRWDWQVHGKGWRRFLRPRNWSPFITVAGRRLWFPSLITIWHVEPGGRDSGEVCKHIRTNRKGERVFTRRWRWHVWHWHIQIRPLQTLKRFLFERCIGCGRRFPWNYAPIAHQWEGPRARWFRINKLAYHHPCSSLVSLRQQHETDKDVVRKLIEYLCLETDVDELTMLDRLTHHKTTPFEFREHYHLTQMLGYERTEDYKLVRSDAKHGANGESGGSSRA